MHLYLYQANTQLIPRQSSLDNLIQSLPDFLHERARRYQSERAATNFAYGRLLLKKGFEDLTENATLEKVILAENGKPLHDDVFFNISHSAYRAICAISLDGSVGVDIEKVLPKDFEHFTNFFSDSEWGQIYAATDPLRTFYQIWTRKESIIKATGLTLNQLGEIVTNLLEKTFSLDGKTWHLTPLDFGHYYIAHACTEFPVETLELRQAKGSGFRQSLCAAKSK